MEAAIRLGYDCWFVAPRVNLLNYGRMENHPHGIQFCTPHQLYHALHTTRFANRAFAPRAMIMEQIPKTVHGVNLIEAAIKFVTDAYHKEDSRIVTVSYDPRVPS
jgi:hypothetical protein